MKMAYSLIFSDLDYSDVIHGVITEEDYKSELESIYKELKKNALVVFVKNRSSHENTTNVSEELLKRVYISYTTVQDESCTIPIVRYRSSYIEIYSKGNVKIKSDVNRDYKTMLSKREENDNLHLSYSYTDDEDLKKEALVLSSKLPYYKNLEDILAFLISVYGVEKKDVLNKTDYKIEKE